MRLRRISLCRDGEENPTLTPRSAESDGCRGRIWYISKYVAPPVDDDPQSIGGRGFEIMAELARSGYRCTVITSDANHLAVVPEVRESVLFQDYDKLRMCWVRTFKAKRAKSLARVVSWIHFEWRLSRLPLKFMERPDVVVVSSLSLLTLLSGIFLKWRLGSRLVVEIRDIWPLTLVDEGGFSANNPLVRLLGLVEWLGYRKADAIVGTMPNLAEHVTRILGYAKETHCIPMGYSPATIDALSEHHPGLMRSFAPPDAFVVGYAGTVGNANALETFFRAAEALSGEKTIRFLVLGDGDLLAEYRNRFGHVDTLTFVPKVPKSQVADILQQCDLLYLATRASERYRYGQSLNKLIDYMLAGKPIVASYSGFPSMIDEAGCGSFVPAEDVPALVAELRRYASAETASLEQMGRQGRAWVLKYRSFAQLAKSYEQILMPSAELSNDVATH